MKKIRYVAGLLFLSAAIVSHQAVVKAEWYWCGGSTCNWYFSGEPYCDGTRMRYTVTFELIYGYCDDLEDEVNNLMGANVPPYYWVEYGYCTGGPGSQSGYANVSYDNPDDPNCY
jgi:hypothetical protein